MNITEIFKGLKGKPKYSFDEKAIDKALDKDKEIEIKPISLRTFTKGGENDTYAEGEEEIGKPDKADENKSPKTVSLPSTAIEKVSYDPKTQICYVKYRKNNQWYSFIMSPEEFKAYMASDSKGRYTNNVMRKANYDSNWKNHKK